MKYKCLLCPKTTTPKTMTRQTIRDHIRHDHEMKGGQIPIKERLNPAEPEYRDPLSKYYKRI